MVDDDVKAAPTLTEMMRRRATLSPGQQYFRLYDETVTYGRLWEQSGRYAAGLARAGVRAGDKICLIYPTCAEFFYTFFGALRVGAVPVPLYPTLGVDTTAAIFRDSRRYAREVPLPSGPSCGCPDRGQHRSKKSAEFAAPKGV